jgi:hypothetical protein
VIVYDSGHARATAVSLGGDELPLATLRARLSALPTALTIVVLDACQSGAFARVKGAEPAADFTYNSVSKLTQKGFSIMASSRQQELSQESDELQGSYFTHHLVTALRGAGDGDGDGDGRVSLDEAYRYAFRRTLASTARTQVGEQHVTLETDLAGQGDVPVTYPAEARARLEFPAALEGRVLVQHRPSGAVAEVQKAKGTALRLALAAGSYDAVVGRTGGIVECRFALTDDQRTTLDTNGCTPVAADRSQTKGGDALEPPEREIDRWALEGSVGFISRETSAPHIVGVGQVGTLSGDTYQRSIAESTDTASFSGYGAGFYVRTEIDVVGRWLGVYGQAGAGLSMAFLTYTTQQTGVPPSATSTYVSYLLGGAVGATIRFRRLPVTLFVQGGYDTAPAIHDLIGDTHDSGGFSATVGARVRMGGGP